MFFMRLFDRLWGRLVAPIGCVIDVFIVIGLGLVFSFIVMNSFFNDQDEVEQD